MRKDIFIGLLLSILVYNQDFGNNVVFDQDVLTSDEQAIDDKLQKLIELGKQLINTNVDSARVAFYEALTIANEHNHISDVADIQRFLGNSFWIEGGYELALQHFFEALTIYEALNNSFGASLALNNIGEVYKKLGDLSSSLHYHYKSLEMKLALPNVKPLISYNNIGEVYMMMGNLDSATYYFERIFNEADSSDDNRSLAYAYAGIGKISMHLGNRSMAIAQFNTSLEIRKSLDDARAIQMSYLNLSDAYFSIARFHVAKLYADSSLQVIKGIKAKDLELNYFLKMYKIDSALGNSATAMQNLQQYYQLRDNLYAQEKSYLIQELNTRFLTEKTKRENENLIYQASLKEAQLNEIRTTIIFISVALITLIALSIILIKSRSMIHKQRNELHQKAYTLQNALSELQSTIEDNQSFSYSVSHDLKAPLRIISFYTSTLLEDVEKMGNTSLLPTINRIKDNINKMEIIIRDILELSMVSQSEVKYQKTNLSIMANEIVSEMSQNQPERNVEIKIQDKMEIMADPGLMNILVKNLLENAWKYTGRREAAKIEFCRENDGTFIVRDNGTGFDTQYYEQIFKPFRRLHSEEEFEGTGIGLSIASRIIKKHQGKIWAESKLNIGTTFFFKIPGKSNQ